MVETTAGNSVTKMIRVMATNMFQIIKSKLR